MLCSQCHKENPPTANYCENCGAKLNMQAGNQNQQQQQQQQAELVTIGRAPQNTIVLQDNDVSANHCRLYKSGGRVVIEDLNSTNGTFVNGHRIMREYIRPNDLVMLGRSRLNLNAPPFQSFFNNSVSYTEYSNQGNTLSFLSWLSAGGSIIVLICFFLPWVEYSCSNVHYAMSGAEIGGIFWIIFLLSVLSLILFFTLKSVKNIKVAFPVFIVSSVISLIILIYKFAAFYNGYDAGYGIGKIKPSDIGFTLREGLYGTFIGLVMTFIGAFFLKEERKQQNIL